MAIPIWIAIFVLAALGVYLLVPTPRPPRTILGPVLLLFALALGLGLVARYRALDLLRLPDFVFFLAAVTAIGSAIKTVSHPRVLYCALYFVLLVLSTAVLVLIASAQFLAAALVLIYAGAIIVVYIFVIMLAQHAGESPYPIDPSRTLLSVVCGMIVATIATRLPLDVPLFPADWKASNVSALGKTVLVDYVVSVELAGVLLLAGVIGAIAVARLRPTQKEARP